MGGAERSQPSSAEAIHHHWSRWRGNMDEGGASKSISAADRQRRSTMRLVPERVVARMHSELASLREELACVREEISGFDELQGSHAASLERIDGITQSCEAIETRLAGQSAASQRADREQDALAETLQALRSRLDDCMQSSAARGDVDQALDEISARFDALEARLTDAGASVATRVDALTADVESVGGGIAALQTQANQHAEQIDAQNTQFNEANARSEQVNKSIAALQLQSQQLTHRCDDITTHVESARSAAGETEARLRQLMQWEQGERETAIAAVWVEASSISDSVSDIAARLNDLHEANDSTVVQLAELTQHITALHAESLQTQQAINNQAASVAQSIAGRFEEVMQHAERACETLRAEQQQRLCEVADQCKRLHEEDERQGEISNGLVEKVQELCSRPAGRDELAQEIESLRAKLDDLAANRATEAQSLRSELHAVSVQVAEAASIRNRIDDLALQISDVQTVVSRQVESVGAPGAPASHEVHEQHQQIDVAAAIRQHLDPIEQAWKQQLEAVVVECDDLKRRLDAQREAASLADPVSNALALDVDDLMRRMAVLEAEVADVTTSVAAANREMASGIASVLDQALRATQARCDQLSSEVRQHLCEISTVAPSSSPANVSVDPQPAPETLSMPTEAESHQRSVQSPFPRTIAGIRGSAFLEAFNSCEPDQLRRFIDAHYAAGALAQRPTAERFKVLDLLRERSEGLRVLGIRSDDPLRIALYAQEKLSRNWMTYQLALDSQAPHGILAMYIDPAEPPAHPVED